MPYADTLRMTTYYLVGGSGGYIYIQTLNKLNKNVIGNKFSIEAQGGYGTNGNYGGSGGVIVFDGGFSVRTEQVTTAGGSAINSKLNIDGCGNGDSRYCFLQT